MTSSLVGSEMCIRDREQTSYHSGGPWPRRRASPPGKPHYRSALHLSKTCLLYTSDAADDM
eukprot:10659025-Prorocentrum_lima.AAC.1